MVRIKRLALILRYRILVPLASYIPEWLNRRINKHWPTNYDDGLGWTFWLDASYYAWVRQDKRKPHVEEAEDLFK